MPNEIIPPLWQILIASAVGSAIVTLFGNMLADWLRHNRTKVQHVQQLILGRKIHECERVFRLTNQYVANLAPISNGFRAFQDAEDGSEWATYRKKMIKDTVELELAFEENAIVLGRVIMRVWYKHSGELVYFSQTAQFGRPSAADMKELMRFCKDLPTELAEAIQSSIQKPDITLLGTEERLGIRNSASAAIEARVEATITNTSTT